VVWVTRHAMRVEREDLRYPIKMAIQSLKASLLTASILSLET